MQSSPHGFESRATIGVRYAVIRDWWAELHQNSYSKRTRKSVPSQKRSKWFLNIQRRPCLAIRKKAARPQAFLTARLAPPTAVTPMTLRPFTFTRGGVLVSAHQHSRRRLRPRPAPMSVVMAYLRVSQRIQLGLCNTGP